MKKRTLRIMAILLVAVFVLAGCKSQKPVELTDKALSAQKIIDFANGANSDVIFESDGWTNGDVFNV